MVYQDGIIILCHDIVKTYVSCLALDALLLPAEDPLAFAVQTTSGSILLPVIRDHAPDGSFPRTISAGRSSLQL
jgi:hypothetical protein